MVNFPSSSVELDPRNTVSSPVFKPILHQRLFCHWQQSRIRKERLRQGEQSRMRREGLRQGEQSRMRRERLRQGEQSRTGGRD